MLSENPEVSIILPTHNRSHLLVRSVGSVLSQTFQNYELIVISDGSTDNTDQIILNFHDSRIIYLKHETSKGASAARNTGIHKSKGKYIAFLDDDDEWVSNKLSMQIPVIRNSDPKVGLVYTWSKYFNNNNEIIQYHKPVLKGNVFLHMLEKQAIGSCPSIIIKRCIIDDIGLFDISLPRGNDGDYWRRISYKFEVDFVPRFLVNVYVGHTDRISINSKKNLINSLPANEKWLELFKETYSIYPKKELIVLIRCFSYCLVAHEFNMANSYFRRIVRNRTILRLKIKLLILAISKFLIKNKTM